MTKIENLLEEAVLGHLEVAPEEGEHLVLFWLIFKLNVDLWLTFKLNVDLWLIFKANVDFVVDFFAQCGCFGI